MRAQSCFHLNLKLSIPLVILFTLSSLQAYAKRLPHVPLLDSENQNVYADQWSKTDSVVAFFYTSCKVACPLTLHAVKAIVDQAAKHRKPMEVLLISLDPEHDSIDRLKRFQRENLKVESSPSEPNLSKSHWHVLSASPAALKALTESLEYHFTKVEGHLLHDRKILVLRSTGEVVTIKGWNEIPENLF